MKQIRCILRMNIKSRVQKASLLERSLPRSISTMSCSLECFVLFGRNFPSRALLLLAIVVNGDNGKGSRVEGSKGRSYKRCYGRKDIEGSLAIKKARSETGVNVNVADDGPEDTPPQKAIVSVEADAQPSREP
ncbi:hypothetical protein V6N13_109388 [Hibiscus sabdariffa]